MNTKNLVDINKEIIKAIMKNATGVAERNFNDKYDEDPDNMEKEGFNKVAEVERIYA